VRSTSKNGSALSADKPRRAAANLRNGRRQINISLQARPVVQTEPHVLELKIIFRDCDECAQVDARIPKVELTKEEIVRRIIGFYFGVERSQTAVHVADGTAPKVEISGIAFVRAAGFPFRGHGARQVKRQESRG